MPVNIAATLKSALRKLETERTRIDRQIVALRGALTSANAAGPGARPRRGRRMSAAARKAIARRMRAYWAKRRAQAAKGKAKGKREAAS